MRFPYTTPIPPIPIPLLPGDAEPILDLNSVLARPDRAGALRSGHRLSHTA